MIIHRVDQGTIEWHQLRLGKPTSSQFDKIITPKTLKASAEADKYMNRLIAERLLNELGEPVLHPDAWAQALHPRRPGFLQICERIEGLLHGAIVTPRR